METTAIREGMLIQEEKFLTFLLGEEEYGIDTIKVKEIVGVMDIIPVTSTNDYLKGAINLRGKVIPIIDLRLKFLMPETVYTQKTRIIVIETCNASIGILIDGISEVLNIKSDEIEEKPYFEKCIDTRFIMGLGKTKGKMIILIDIDALLSFEELELIKHIH